MFFIYRDLIVRVCKCSEAVRRFRWLPGGTAGWALCQPVCIPEYCPVHFFFQSGISPLIGEEGSPLDHVSIIPSSLQEFMVKVRVRVNPKG